MGKQRQHRSGRPTNGQPQSGAAKVPTTFEERAQQRLQELQEDAGAMRQELGFLQQRANALTQALIENQGAQRELMALLNPAQGQGDSQAPAATPAGEAPQAEAAQEVAAAG